VRQRPSEERLSPGTRPRSVGDVLRAPSLGLGRAAGDAVFAGSALRIMGQRAVLQELSRAAAGHASEGLEHLQPEQGG
jgi:hypothetical protein